MRSKHRSGFTLVEIIVAIAILSIVLVSFMSSFSFGFSTIFKMGGRTKAIHDAQNIIDSNDYSGMTDYTASGYDMMISQPYNPANDQKGRFCDIADAFSPLLNETGTDMVNESHDVRAVMKFTANGQDYVILTAYKP